MPLPNTASTTTEIEITTPADPTENSKARTNNANDNTGDESSSDLLTNENTKTNASEENEVPSNNINNSSNNCNSSDSSNSITSNITNTITASVDTQAAFNTPMLNGNNTPVSVTEQSDESNLEQPIRVIAANGNNKNGKFRTTFLIDNSFLWVSILCRNKNDITF